MEVSELRFVEYHVTIGEFYKSLTIHFKTKSLAHNFLLSR